ncbi:hypothetical protein YC2023_064817 [Brassica napus]
MSYTSTHLLYDQTLLQMRSMVITYSTALYVSGSTVDSSTTVCSKSCDVQIDVRCTSVRESRSSMKAIHSIKAKYCQLWCLWSECIHCVWTALIVASLWDMTAAPLFISNAWLGNSHSGEQGRWPYHVTESQLFLMFSHLGRIVICASPVAKTQQVLVSYISQGRIICSSKCLQESQTLEMALDHLICSDLKGIMWGLWALQQIREKAQDGLKKKEESIFDQRIF